jgi:hypothetical protein
MNGTLETKQRKATEIRWFHFTSCRSRVISIRFM